MVQNGEQMYYVRKGRVLECRVLYSEYDSEIKERYYITDGLCFVHSDIGCIVFRSEEEAKGKADFANSNLDEHCNKKK